MSQVSILYVEHEEKYAKQVVYAFEKADALVDWVADLEGLRTNLRRKRYDVVVTDAFFGDSPDDCRLGEIVAEVRSVDNQRVRLIVLTKYSHLLFDEHKAELDNIDDLWVKGAARQDYLYWKVKRLESQFFDNMQDHALATCLRKLLVSGKAEELPWAEEMLEMIEEYRDVVGANKQFEAVKNRMIRIGGKIGWGTSFLRLYEAMGEMEALNVGGKPEAWGHRRHVLNVFWLGYVFWNSGVVKLEDVGQAAGLTPGNGGSAADLVNESWLLCSLFHDIGLFGERLPDILERCRDLEGEYPCFELNIEADGGWKGQEDDVAKTFAALTGVAGGASPREWLGMLRERVREHVDHGVLSAVTLRSRDREKLDGRVIDMAAYAAAVHNFPRWSDLGAERKAKGKLKPPEFEFWEDPLAWLLVFCDQVEAWDRETGEEGRYSGLALERAELLEISTEGRFFLKVNYVPYRSIAPGSEAWKKLRNDLSGLLQKKTIAALNQLKIGRGGEPRVSVEFVLQGREKLNEWTPLE